MTPETITVSQGVISINSRPLLRFASTAQAGIWLCARGYKVTLREDVTYTFSK